LQERLAERRKTVSQAAIKWVGKPEGTCPPLLVPMDYKNPSGVRMGQEGHTVIFYGANWSGKT